MKVKNSCKDDVFKSIDLQEDDIILYLGGRIDDDNLYPVGYRKYLRDQVERLSPSKIICHNYWYAKKYYENGILSEDTKIDMVLSFYCYFIPGEIQGINPKDYDGHRDWIKILIDKNPNIVYALCIDDNDSLGNRPPSVDVNDDWFGEDYDLNNVKYFDYDRRYSTKDLTGEDLGYGEVKMNASGGFAMIMNMLNVGFKNLNILGFTAFSSDEDESHFTPYGLEYSHWYGGRCKKYAGKKYFDLQTSENQRAESDILQHWVRSKKINNVEDCGELKRHLKET